MTQNYWKVQYEHQSKPVHFSNDHFVSGFCNVLSRFRMYRVFLEPYLNAILHDIYCPQCALSLLLLRTVKFRIKVSTILS